MTPFTNSSLRWLPGEPSDSGFCAYLEEPQVTGLRANPCTATAHGLICEKATGEIFMYFSTYFSTFRNLTRFALPPVQEIPVRVPAHPARNLVRCTPTVPTAPARARSACGAAAHSVALTPLLMSSLFLMASVWSGRLEIVLVSVFF